MFVKRLLIGLAVAGWSISTVPAAAEAPLSEPQGPAQRFAEGEDEVLALDELEDLAGGDGVEINMLTTQQLTAINAGNSVSGETIGSGAVTIGTDAFSGFDGIGNFVINTGHNNNLQSSLNVSIVLAP